MTEDALLVDEVEIVRAPGFETGGFPVDEFSSGINVVYGPNASGKSTLARAKRWLLWPETMDCRGSVTGKVKLDGRAWRVDVDSGRARYQCDGEADNGPNLPPADHRDRYHLSLHDLLQHETRNESFARTVERESAGGYDLRAARDQLGFDDSLSTRRKGVVRDAERAVEDWREANSEVESLRDEEARLDALRGDLEDARRAKEEVDLLDRAIEYARARDELAAARDRLESYPDVLEEIDGDEIGRVDRLEEEVEERKREKRAAREERETDRKQLDEADLPGDGLPEGFVDRLERLRDDLASLEDDRDECEAALANAERKRERARGDVPLEVAGGDIADLDPGVWQEVSEFARAAERVAAEREVQEAVGKWLGAEGDADVDAAGDADVEQSTLRRGERALENWLANPPDQGADGSGVAVRVAAVSALIVAAAGAALGFLVSPALYALVLVAAGLLWYGVRSSEGGADDGRPRGPYREEYEGLPLDPPGAWTEDGVRERLTGLYDAVASRRLADERERWRETLEGNHDDLERRERSLDERRSSLRDRLGVAPDATDVELTVTVRAVLRWQEAHDDVLGLEDEIETVDAQIAAKRREIGDALDPYGYGSVTDAATVTQHVRDLEDRRDRHAEATKEIDRANEVISETEDEIAALRTERDGIFTAVGLDTDDRDRLRELCEQADEFREAKSAVEDARLLAENEADALAERPGYDPELEDRDVSDLEAARRDAEETAADYDDVRDEITEIQTRIDEAKRENDVEDALAERERALGALREQFEADAGAVVGDVLVDHVQEATEEASRPAVFTHARETLARITRGRYRLVLDGRADSFRAYDTVKEREFALDELSSATQLQVLLAVRVAFVERQEQGVRLPLLLDETLANTDDARADVVVDATIELAREERQVFYYTAQGDEVARWRAALEETEGVAHSVIDLADARGLDGRADGRVDVPDLDEVAARPESPPTLDGHDRDSYGDALDVPAFDPRRGAGRTHLWYLVDDLETLHSLLELGIERWGQLENLLSEVGLEVVGDDPELREDLECSGRAVEEFVRSWRRGRGRRVDRRALEDSGAVSDNFIDEVSEFARDVDGNAERIVEGLRAGEVDRFRSAKADELEEHFEDAGYIASRDRLEPEQIRVRVVDCLVANGVPRERAVERTGELLDRLTASRRPPRAPVPRETHD